MSDSGGNVAWQADYEPSGSLYQVRTGASIHQPLRLPGQEAELFDGSAGINGFSGRLYNGARWYRPQWGRYTQGDPLSYAGSPYNLYAYAGNNPIDSVDPLGLCGSGLPWWALPVAAAVGLIAGLAAFAAAGGPFDPLAFAAAAWTAARAAAVAAAAAAVAAEAAAPEVEDVVPEVSGGAGTTATRAFWSGPGAEETANAWANENEGTVLGMTEEGQAVAEATQGMSYEEAQLYWDQASLSYANSASGDIIVFQGPVVSLNSTWARVEYPALMANPNVTSITYVRVGW